MFKFPPALIVQKDNVWFLVYVVGGLLMTVTAGGHCVEVAVRTSQNRDKMLQLPNFLFQLMGLGQRTFVASIPRPQNKRLYFTESFKSLHRDTQPGFPGLIRLIYRPASPETHLNLQSTGANSVSAKRCRIYYILIGGSGGRPVLTLCLGTKSRKLRTYRPLNQLQWLVDFNRKSQDQGDKIVLLVDGQTAQNSSEPETNEDWMECQTTGLTLGFSALLVLLLWMILPHIALCAVILLVWKMHQQIHREELLKMSSK
ncbi:uncharacterized protein LOC112488165 [Cynoglossus semilaevis]|uniref:uncharacterized protein LOC112488165 n=1 Tax=Cynoglossus semilaevis TaxID=244447 RepID=UPI000D62945F|nr:uncharacterized protein LOC112488165 [Cynoglossus semilaevis]